MIAQIPLFSTECFVPLGQGRLLERGRRRSVALPELENVSQIAYRPSLIASTRFEVGSRNLAFTFIVVAFLRDVKIFKIT
jgi:hypothetical protein